MRRELGWSDDQLSPDWIDRFVEVHARGADEGELRYFVALLDGDVVGSALALRRKSISDGYLGDTHRGYLANIFVEEPYRRRGLARVLTSAAVEWLRSIGCEAIYLQASEPGRPLYESMGFESSGEMVLRLHRARQEAHRDAQ